MKNVIVIKIGGVASQKLNQSVIDTIEKWRQEGKKLVIVHGGGYAIDDLMTLRQIAVKKVDGIRVTPEEALTCVVEGLKEIVGPKLAKNLNQGGLDVIQIDQGLSRMIEADFLNRKAYGYVGQVTKLHPDYLYQILDDGLIPLIPSLGYSVEGQLLNINADDVASFLAVALQAEKLVLMTDVSGVKDNDQVLSQLTLEEVDEKIAEGIITGNMIPKVKGAVQAVLLGVASVYIGKDLQGGTQILKGN